MLKKVILESDILIEVVDARSIEDTRNFKMEKWITKKLGKELIVAASKADLVNEEMLKQQLKSIPFKTAYFSYTQRKGAGSIKTLLYTITHYIKKKKKINKVKVGIIGYANVGKSSLIDLLVRASKAKHSPIPGFTRGIKWIKLRDDILLIDTPGIFDSEELKVEKCNIDPAKTECYLYVIDFLERIKDKPHNLEELLNVDLKSKEPSEILKYYAKKRNFVLKGNKLDEERAAKEIVRLWNEGKIAFK